MSKSIFFKSVRLAHDEELYESTDVWAFDFKYFWFMIIALIILYFIPISLLAKIPLVILILWYGSYSFRQNWRLTLTNRRIIARRLYPRPLDYFFTRVHNFPYRHLEGLSTGPRNNVTLFLIGLFVMGNLGINVLKSSLSAGELELPDAIEFIIFLLILLPPYRNQGELIQNDLEVWYRDFAQDVLRTAGTIFFIVGLALLLISFPWKQFLVLRVRYAKDFKLRTTVSNKFIAQLYARFYETPTQKPPNKFRKWHFPWLEGEEVENIADFEQILYANQIIGTFALITTSIRIWQTIEDVSSFTSLEFLLWLSVALLDLATIILSIIYSKRDNEFVITNKRIIFSQEVRQLSGVIGKRYFFISDLKRNDIASFQFRKVSSFAMEYLITGIAVFYTGILLLTSDLAIFGIIFMVISLFLFFFVYQTYVGFSLKTKSGDTWVMRHQLANPATRLRQFIGEEQSVFSHLLANRLEEKEIIDTVQTLRTRDIGLKAQKFDEAITRSINVVTHASSDSGMEFRKSKFLSRRFQTKRFRQRQTKRIQLALEDILLKDERVVWEKVIPYPLNYRFISLFLGTVFFILTLPSMFFVALRLNINTTTKTLSIQEVNPSLTAICIISAIILYALFQLKYFSLRRKSMVITEKRIFYEELVRPPKWLFFLGIFRDSLIRESLIDQLQTVSTGKYWVGGYNWDKFKASLKEVIYRSIIWFGSLYLYLLTQSYWASQTLSTEIGYILQFVLFSIGLLLTWSASNMIVQFIQAWPSIELDATGIGVNFKLPYLTLSQAEQAKYSLWSGIDPYQRVKLKLEEKRRKKQHRRTGD